MPKSKSQASRRASAIPKDSARSKPARVESKPRSCESFAAPPESTDYESHKVRANARQREQSADKREIGPLPPVENPARRAACEQDFALYLKTYFPNDVRHPWSPTHVKLIESIQLVVLVGAMLAVGIPRGWAKTFLCVRAIMWAVCYRHHTMAMLIAASDAAAQDLIQDIRDELETNLLLQADFPEVCLPIAELEGINQRGKGQTCNGQRTNVKADKYELHLGDVMLPVSPSRDSESDPASETRGTQYGCVIYAGGITGSRIRGRRKVLGGQVRRPTLGLIDDFQTRQSARSRGQCQVRLNIVSDDIPGLPGNDQAWSCLLTCTVIEAGDAADQLLDRSQHPDWRGIRAAFLESLPNEDALEHWDEWNRIRVEDLQSFDKDEEDIEQEAISERAHAYYRKHFKAMNSGASVAWRYAFKPEHYVDALEKAMHWYYRSRRGFWSELQNQPEKFEKPRLPQLQAQILSTRLHDCPQHVVPEDAELLTVHADVSKAVLWYEVRAWAMDSTSWTIDYGTWPAQSRSYYTQATAQHTIDLQYAHLPTWKLRCMAAINDLFKQLFDKQWLRSDGSVIRLNMAGIDANDETETVRLAIKRSGLSGKLWPMHSRSFRPPKTPLAELPLKDGDAIGENWRRRRPETGSLRYITYDTDYWKSHHRNRLMMAHNLPGAISWFRGSDHRMLADHHVSEYSDTFTHDATNRTMEIWGKKPGEDNHLWDVGVGNDVLGNLLGCTLPDSMILDARRVAGARRRKKKKIRITL